MLSSVFIILSIVSPFALGAIKITWTGIGTAPQGFPTAEEQVKAIMAADPTIDGDNVYINSDGYGKESTGTGCYQNHLFVVYVTADPESIVAMWTLDSGKWVLVSGKKGQKFIRNKDADEAKNTAALVDEAAAKLKNAEDKAAAEAQGQPWHKGPLGTAFCFGAYLLGSALMHAYGYA